MQKNTLIMIGTLLVLLAIYLMCGQASGALYTDANGTRTVISDMALDKQIGDTPEIAAARIRGWSGTDDDFVDNVYRYASRNIHYTDLDTLEIMGPDRALREGYGDCSEIAVLSERMLKSQGIDARIISGIDSSSGYPHMSVEVHIGKYSRIIDREYLPTFSKVQEGLWGGEYIVD